MSPASYIIRSFRPADIQLAICFHVDILLGLFNLKDGGDIFLWNIGRL
jgi:hypothetical protein